MTIAPIDALRALHEELWDPERGMDRFAPGATPDLDISSLHLHAVRETINGAFLDLGDGHIERAVTAIRNVLALQYPVSEHPWSSTFPVSAEQLAPPIEGAVEWVHYDPNWRQFVGCALALCAINYSDVLPDDVVAGIDTAVQRCVAGEPDDRIPRWYTNPNLMHAWLQGYVATSTGDVMMRAAAHVRIGTAMERMLRYGDVDEYNSPTYDGIDLFALGLWAAHPPTDGFADAAATMLARVGRRISTLYHPRFGTTCGPYIRAYGLDPRAYVSLSGLVASLLGEPVALVLPSPLDADTVHVHDLYFLPLLDHVAAVLRPHLHMQPVVEERLHLQRFREALAESLLRPDLAVGWDQGRRHGASLDQYVPFTAHVADADGAMTTFGIMLPEETAWIDVERVGDLEFVVRAAGGDDSVGLRIVSNSRLTVAPEALTAGRITLTFDSNQPVVHDHGTPSGGALHLGWNTGNVMVRLTISG